VQDAKVCCHTMGISFEGVEKGFFFNVLTSIDEVSVKRIMLLFLRIKGVERLGT
jgi:hypothetical protein